jgi:hypothetical protein
MKKLVFASVMAMASISLVVAPALRAQDSTITIKDPAEYNAYQMATTQADNKARAAALETFLQTYPQSVVKADVLDRLVDAYQALNDGDHLFGAADRLLQIDANNFKAVVVSVAVKKAQCIRTADVQACDDAGRLAKKGLLLTKGKDTSDADWKTQTSTFFPGFHSAIALDDAIAHKDFKGAVAEFTAELMLYTDDQSKSLGLSDTLHLADAYAQPDAKDPVKAIWFYARAFDFAPANYKPTIEKSLNYWYKKYHGDLKGLDDIKTQAAATTFPPGTLVIAAAKTPAEQIHDLIVSTPDLSTLALDDKETVLALGTKEDQDKLWAVVKDKPTPVPGVVIDASASVLKVIVTVGVKPTELTVALKAPVACSALPAATDLKASEEFVTANGVKDDADKAAALFADEKTKKVVVEATVSTIKVAVVKDARDAKTADFIVNLKTPIGCKEAPAAGFEFKVQPAAELDGTYDTYTQIPATDKTAQSAQIVLKDAFIQAAEAKKKPAAPAHKPAAGHKPA